MTKASAKRRVGIFGGTFNPVHSGHMRLAIEAREVLGLDRLDLVPCLSPPHKGASGLLPFELRARLVEAAAERCDGIALSRIEAELPAPSYTWRTLERFAELEPDARAVFVMGSGDLFTLPQWNRGLELPGFADLAIFPREEDDLEDAAAFIAEHWPGARQEEPAAHEIAHPVTGGAAWRFEVSGKPANILWLPLPRLDVSGSMIRERWNAGRSVAFLVPGAVARILDQEIGEVRRSWSVPEAD